jgi:glycerol uptake facilitator-like aquaporin
MTLARCVPCCCLCDEGAFSSLASSCVSQAFLAESMWTFLLVMVVLSTASAKRENNNYFGLCIGAIVLTGDAFFGEWSNGMFNPAVGLGTCVISISEKSPYNGLWVYLVCAILLFVLFAAV